MSNFKHLWNLPCPMNLSFNWNYGFILSFVMVSQLISGIFLSFHYVGVSLDPGGFFSLSSMIREINYGFIIQMIHAVGASLFFVFLFCHIGRGLYYFSFHKVFVWGSGMSIFILAMASAFLGYVLPYGQMSYWGATVIMKFFSVAPFMGETLVIWMCGSFAVGDVTLSRFFSLHFLMPFVLAVFSLVHLFFLHEFGSSNPLKVDSNWSKVSFAPFYVWKDLLGMLILLFFFVFLFNYLMLIQDPTNYIQADSLNTPEHIQPEWYFLSVYAVLRSVPSKGGGVLALILFLGGFFLLGHLKFSLNFYSTIFKNLMVWLFFFNMVFLSWIGMNPVEEPYFSCGAMSAFFHFLVFGGVLMVCKSNSSI